MLQFWDVRPNGNQAIISYKPNLENWEPAVHWGLP